MECKYINQVAIIGKRHNEWLRVAMFHGLPIEDAQDLVQDFYCKLMELGKKEGSLDRIFVEDGSVNEVYIFQSIRNRAINFKKLNGKVVSLEENNCKELKWEDDKEIRESKEEDEVRLEKVAEVMKGLKRFDRNLLVVYYRDGKSLRKLAKEIGISFPTILYSYRTTKKHIKEQLKKMSDENTKENNKEKRNRKSKNKPQEEGNTKEGIGWGKKREDSTCGVG